MASRFYRWCCEGGSDWLLAEVHRRADACGDLDRLCRHVDGTVVRAHQHAAGACHQPGEQDRKGIVHSQDEALGTSRDGLSTKLY